MLRGLLMLSCLLTMTVGNATDATEGVFLGPDQIHLWRQQVVLADGRAGVMLLTEHREARSRANVHLLRMAEPMEAWWITVSLDEGELGFAGVRRLGYVPRKQYAVYNLEAHGLGDSVVLMGGLGADSIYGLFCKRLSLSGISAIDERVRDQALRNARAAASGLSGTIRYADGRVESVFLDPNAGREIDWVLRNSPLNNLPLVLHLGQDERNRLVAVLRSGDLALETEVNGAWKIERTLPVNTVFEQENPDHYIWHQRVELADGSSGTIMLTEPGSSSIWSERHPLSWTLPLDAWWITLPNGLGEEAVMVIRRLGYVYRGERDHLPRFAAQALDESIVLMGMVHLGDTAGLSMTRLPLAGVSRTEDEQRRPWQALHDAQGARVVDLPTPNLVLPNVDGILSLDRDAQNRLVAVVIKDHRFHVAQETQATETWEIRRELPMRMETSE